MLVKISLDLLLHFNGNKHRNSYSVQTHVREELQKRNPQTLGSLGGMIASVHGDWLGEAASQDESPVGSET